MKRMQHPSGKMEKVSVEGEGAWREMLLSPAATKAPPGVQPTRPQGVTVAVSTADAPPNPRHVTETGPI